MCISFANEIQGIAEPFDVDMSVVRDALRADRRIGPKAYVDPGRPFTGGTLKRDLRALQTTARDNNRPSRLIDAVLTVNANMERKRS
jgi:UDPglucose 6-dehydrogenase